MVIVFYYRLVLSTLKILFLQPFAGMVVFILSFWDVSSVGLEHLLDRQGVTGSIPVRPTLRNKELG